MEQEKSVSKVGVGGYIALAVAILFFSGLLMKVDGMKWLSAFDFTTLGGKFGTMKDPIKNTFLGAGGVSAKAGFLFALSLAPTVMLALGCLEVLTHYGAIRAAHKLMTPLLQPLLSLPGKTGLALITDLQSTDAGAALTKELYDEGEINKKELTIMGAWQYSGAGLINNYFTIGSALFAVLKAPIILPLVLMFVMKFVGGMFVRFVLSTVYKEDFKDEQ
ncbi:MAG: nucleoside recognition domain-containing protein [Acidaminococcaceae bacterium]